MSHRASVWVLLVGLAVVGVDRSSAQTLAQADADSLQRKLSAIVTRGAEPVRPATTSRSTSLSDREINAFFKFRGKDFLPAGVVNPQLATEPNGRVRATALVDLDAVRQSQPRGWFDPLAWVSGRLEVAAIAVLRASGGTGVVALESATVAGIAVPKSLMQDLVTYYSKGPDAPNGFAFDQPFALPAKIQSVQTARGSAVIVQ